jgi:predicted 3-demethylubiquinone-9 3-methyltransferase (glyoxalase superfamily)
LGKLSEGGEEARCGWLKDKYGLSWQVIPTTLGKLLGDPDAQKSARVMNAILQMGKIDIDKLKEAHEKAA